MGQPGRRRLAAPCLLASGFRLLAQSKRGIARQHFRTFPLMNETTEEIAAEMIDFPVEFSEEQKHVMRSLLGGAEPGGGGEEGGGTPVDGEPVDQSGRGVSSCGMGSWRGSDDGLPLAAGRSGLRKQDPAGPAGGAGGRLAGDNLRRAGSAADRERCVHPC